MSYGVQLPALIPISSRSILIFSPYLRLGLPKGLFPVGLPVKILKALLPSSFPATCPATIGQLEIEPWTAASDEVFLPLRHNGRLFLY